MIETSPLHAPAGTPVSQRAPGPDVARGAMLLLIALANAHVYVTGHDIGFRGYPEAELMGTGERVLTAAQLLLVDGRAFPMFSLLFGYGIVQLARRHEAAGAEPGAVRRLVRRRGWWMVLIGAVHGVLLWPADIIGAYGLIAVLFAGVLLRGRIRRLVVPGLLLLALTGAGQGFRDPSDATTLLPSLGQDSALLALAYRVPEWLLLGVLLQVLLLVAAVAVGSWAARRRLLEEPERHHTLLVRVAAGGLGAAVLGGLPLAMMATGVWAEPGIVAQPVAGLLHALGGYAGGAGYAALFALVASRAAARRGPVLRALAATGQRSMTSYLAQSVVFCALLASWGGGLGPRLGMSWAALIGVGTWLLTVLAATWMASAGVRGPAEVLLRRLTYGRRPATATTERA
ncbi:DUF418 domain-containing protein [Kineococcus sp. NUM-3379]